MSGEITRYQPGAVDSNRVGGRTGGDVGSGSSGQGEAHESAQVQAIRKQISQITRLAHTGKSKDEDSYKARQPELRNLMAQLVAAQNGGAVATMTDGAPADTASYANLVHSNWSTAWDDAKPALLDAGITPAQSMALANALVRAEKEANLQAQAAFEQRRADSKRELAKLYGSSWQQEVDKGNKLTRELLPDGAGPAFFDERLADGSRLGDHITMCRMLIEIARDRRR